MISKPQHVVMGRDCCHSDLLVPGSIGGGGRSHFDRDKLVKDFVS